MAKVISLSAFFILIFSCASLKKRQAHYHIQENTNEIRLSDGILKVVNGDSILYASIEGTHGINPIPHLKNSKQTIRRKIDKKYKKATYLSEPMKICALDESNNKHAVWVFQIKHKQAKDSIITFDAMSTIQIQISNKHILKLFYPEYKYPHDKTTPKKIQKGVISIGGDRNSNCGGYISNDSVKHIEVKSNKPIHDTIKK